MFSRYCQLFLKILRSPVPLGTLILVSINLQTKFEVTASPMPAILLAPKIYKGSHDPDGLTTTLLWVACHLYN